MIKVARFFITLCFALMFFCPLIVSASSDRAASSDPLVRINEAYHNGDIDLDSKAMLIVDAIKNPQNLPVQYQSEELVLGLPVGRSATMALVEIWQNLDQLTPQTQQVFAEAMARPSGAYTFDSPGGFFKLHYNTVGTDAVPTADNNSDGIPDFVYACATYCDTSLVKHRELNYFDPPSDGGAGGDNLFDVYFENMGYYGYAMPEATGPEPWDDASSYLVLNNNFLGFPPNTDPEGNVAGAAKATAAHELHHCCQFAYDYNAEGWFMEVDATYMEDIVFDHVNDNYNYLPPYLASPEASLMQGASVGYYRFIWGLYLAQRFDTSLMTSIWEGARYTSIFQAMSDTLEGKYSITQDSAFLEFTLWNYFTGSRDIGEHHEEASFYPTLSEARSFSYYPVISQVTPDPVFGYGATYISFKPNASTGTLSLVFNATPLRDWAAYIIKIPNTGGYEIESLSLDAGNDGTIEVPEFENYLSIVLVGVNLTEYSYSSSFYYEADVHVPFEFDTYVLSDSTIYPGELKYFRHKLVNIGTSSEVVDLIYSDSKGWMVPGTLSFYLSDGDSVTALIPFEASETLSLGLQTQLEFRSQLRSSPASGTTDLLFGYSVNKRGDVNYDKKVNLTDITQLIDFVYLNGTTPNPPESGDFTCDGRDNLADITAIISFVYLNGDKAPCDSYEH